MKNRYDHITEVNKFNPFHDARGRFSSSSGFKSYSANPNTKAGAMAIARSAAAGHFKTKNVHRAAYGQDIQHNANWLAVGNQQNNRQRGSTTLRSRVEPVSGLRGASAMGAQWQSQNQARGKVRTVSPRKPNNAASQAAQQQATLNQTPKQQAKPAQQATTQKPGKKDLAQDVTGISITNAEKMSIKQRNRNGMVAGKVTKVAEDAYQARVQGKDISKTFDHTKIKGNKRGIDKVAEIQGWNKPATVTNDLETFQKAAIKSGRVMYRSVSANQFGSGDKICKTIMTDPNTSLGGTGGKVYGGGMYVTDCKITSGTTNAGILSRKLASSSKESYYYGNTQMMATVHPDAKISSKKQSYKMQNEFYSMTAQQRMKFDNDVGAYIASKGYDGAKWHGDNSPQAYTTIYNKSAMIFYGSTVNAN